MNSKKYQNLILRYCKIGLDLTDTMGLYNGLQVYLSRLSQHFKMNDKSALVVSLHESRSSAHMEITKYLKNENNLIYLANDIDPHIQKAIPTSIFLGFQRHFVDLQMLNKLTFESGGSRSLGLLQSDLNSIEPACRTSEIAVIDLNVLRFSDYTCSSNLPTGLSIEQLCQILGYIGRSIKIRKVLFILNENELSNIQYLSIATMIWYLNEGLEVRAEKQTDTSLESFYIQHKDLDDDLIFYFDTESEEWWVKIDNSHGEMIPCHKKDYDNALKGVIDDHLMNKILYLAD